mmetsp:Transcript_6692/g.11931  ORF Transcript_6692/g.11931 Transcript_6692/m.11931 type:complete len:114 (+) Transcript_6692:125-466(+)
MTAGASDRQQKAHGEGEGGTRAPRMTAAGSCLQQVTEIGRDATISNAIGGDRGEHGGVRGSKRKEGKCVRFNWKYQSRGGRIGEVLCRTYLGPMYKIRILTMMMSDDEPPAPM